MCIVIDTNTLSCVFNKESSVHSEFAPVQEWIVEDKGKLIYGGTRYRLELKKARRYRKLVIELKKAGKAIEVDSQEVDTRQQEIEGCLEHRDFNDSHIIAIVIVSRVRLICSCDRKAHPFFKMGVLYPKHFKRPKIYTAINCKDLLCDQNIVGVCC
jgi:hypothetical protein